MRLPAYLFALFCGLIVLLLPGCAVTPDQINKTIDTVGPVGLYDVLLEEDSPTIKKDAQFISTAISTDILPFVQNSQLPASQLVPQLRKLLGAKTANSKIVGAVLTVVSLATSLGNIDIKAPAMSDIERQYIIHSLTAIQKACDGYVSGKGVAKAFRQKCDGTCELLDQTEGRSGAYLDERGNHHDGPAWLEDYDSCEVCSDHFAAHNQSRAGSGGSLRRTTSSGDAVRPNTVIGYARCDKPTLSMDAICR